MESIIESLEKFGLTRYEAKAYIGMTNLISGKAEEIARASEINNPYKTSRIPCRASK